MVLSVAKKVVVAVIGLTVLIAGVIMIVTPGPALLVIPLGLSILAGEFAWARYWLRKYKNGAVQAWNSVSGLAAGQGVKSDEPSERTDSVGGTSHGADRTAPTEQRSADGATCSERSFAESP